jgi:flavin-dependent dehydrogenase
MKVLLAEQKQFPRPKLCGEFISPECLGHFAELGVLEQMTLSGGVDLERTVFYSRSGRSVTVPSEWFSAGSNALGLSRAKMDAVLMSHAAAAGVDVRQNMTAVGLLRNADSTICGVRLRDESHRTLDIHAHLVIDATGRSRILVRLADPTTKKRRADFVAFKTHLSGAAVPEHNCEIYSYRGGYGGSSRVEGGLNNVCFIINAAIAKQHGSDAEQIMRNVLFTNRQAKRSLGEAQVAEQWLAVPIENYGRSALSPTPGLIAIGDAAGFIDPFTGSGILLALESSRIAADAITAAGMSSFAAMLSEYQMQYTSAFENRLKVSSIVRKAAFVPFFADAVINGLSLSKRLTRRLAKATRPVPGGQS